MQWIWSLLAIGGHFRSERPCLLGNYTNEMFGCWNSLICFLYPPCSMKRNACNKSLEILGMVVNLVSLLKQLVWKNCYFAERMLLALVCLSKLLSIYRREAEPCLHNQQLESRLCFAAFILSISLF